MKLIPAEGRIDPEKIDFEALKVIRRLHHFGYEAFLVGGAVRDLWLGRMPKDFDLATDASPRQIKRTFSNSRLIGRRFRLAHVFFGPKIFEVSTFRANITAPDEQDMEERDLLVWDDNVFGTAEEDALRRDFTINGLFYDPDTSQVIDYVGGIDDLEKRLVRTIGDPEIRFREDPVRILRAVKFAARLGFPIEENTWQAALRTRDDILRCSPARVHEEIMRLLSGGSAAASLRLMWDMGILDLLLPDLAEYLRQADDPETSPVWSWLAALDNFDRERYPLTGGLVVGAAYGGIILDRIDDPDHAIIDYGLRVDHVVDTVAQNLRLPRRESALLKQVLIARRRLQRIEEGRRRRGSLAKMRGKGYFGAAVAFAEMELAASGASAEDVQSWREKLGMAVEPLPVGEASGEPRRRRRRRRRPRPSDSGNVPS